MAQSRFRIGAMLDANIEVAQSTPQDAHNFIVGT
jgi:hypothetical protein